MTAASGGLRSRVRRWAEHPSPRVRWLIHRDAGQPVRRSRRKRLSGHRPEQQPRTPHRRASAASRWPASRVPKATGDPSCPFATTAPPAARPGFYPTNTLGDPRSLILGDSIAHSLPEKHFDRPEAVFEPRHTQRLVQSATDARCARASPASRTNRRWASGCRIFSIASRFRLLR